MRSWQETRLTGVVKRHDPKLFVNKDDFGRMNVWRESYELRPYFVNNATVYCLESAPHYIMSLTHDWQMTGKPCEWGVDPLLNRLRAMDTWSATSFVNAEMEDVNAKIDQSKQRDMNNKLEAAAYESHAVFKKTFSDVNVASMNKIDKRRKKGA